MTLDRRYTSGVRCLAFFALTSVCPGPALAAVCAQWAVGSRLVVVQSNGTYAFMEGLKQTGTEFKGYGNYSYQYDTGRIGVGRTESRSANGPVVGTVVGNSFEATVYWSNASVGVYQGQIGPQGLIVGRTYDKTDPGAKADWHSNTPLDCAASPTPATGAPPPRPTLQLGRVAPREALPAMSICDAAKSARARNSPAAAGLESRCKTQTAQAALSATGGATAAPSLKIQNPLASGALSAAPADRALPHVAAGPAAPLKPVMDEAWRSKNLAAGAEMAGRDPRAKELFDLMPKGRPHDGFAIGLSVVGSDTADSPAKQAIRKALDLDEQTGYDMALAYALPRNLRADYAYRGMAIATLNSAVGQKRNASAAAIAVAARVPDAAVFYKLGFDIGLGLNEASPGGATANPALGARMAFVRGSLSGGNGHLLTGFDDALNFMRGR